MPSALGASQSLQFLPSGAMVDFAGTVAPAGWLMCDGSAVSRTVYASLFAAISTAYGAGDGSTTFNLPDFRGRFARYNDNMGTAAGAASRDTGRVHGSSQTDATAPKGLSATQVSHSHTFPLAITYTGSVAPPSCSTGSANGATQGTSSAQPAITLSSTDTETRPINLSCNRIIKY